MFVVGRCAGSARLVYMFLPTVFAWFGVSEDVLMYPAVFTASFVLPWKFGTFVSYCVIIYLFEYIFVGEVSVYPLIHKRAMEICACWTSE